MATAAIADGGARREEGRRRREGLWRDGEPRLAWSSRVAAATVTRGSYSLLFAAAIDTLFADVEVQETPRRHQIVVIDQLDRGRAGTQLTTGEPAPAEAEARPRVQFAPAPNPAPRRSPRVGARVGAPSASAVPEQDSGATRGFVDHGEAGGARPTRSTSRCGVGGDGARAAGEHAAGAGGVQAGRRARDAGGAEDLGGVGVDGAQHAHRAVAWRSALPTPRISCSRGRRGAPRSIEIRVNGAARVIQCMGGGATSCARST